MSDLVEISALEFTAAFETHRARHDLEPQDPPLVHLAEHDTTGHDPGDAVFGDPETRRPVVACRLAADGSHTHWRYPTEEPTE